MKIAVIGAGNMVSALVAQLARARHHHRRATPRTPNAWPPRIRARHTSPRVRWQRVLTPSCSRRAMATRWARCVEPATSRARSSSTSPTRSLPTTWT